jgi:NAD(P)H-flavin reductase
MTSPSEISESVADGGAVSSGRAGSEAMAVAELTAGGEERPYYPRPARVVCVSPLTETETLLEIAMEDAPSRSRPDAVFQGERGFHPSPGTFVQVTIPGVGECPISVCSAARPDGRFELCVRRVGLVTAAIHRLRVGDRIGIRGPFGRGFPVDRVTGMDLLIIAGGLGMAPLRSLVHHVRDRRSRYGEVTIVYGTRSPADLLFRDELFSLYHERSFRVLMTVDVSPGGDWSGLVGPVTTPLRVLEVDPARTASFIVGPPVMFRYVLEVLREKKLPDAATWCSFERRMYCGIGKCGQCQMEDLLTCRDGPVLSVAELAGREDVL